jgi:carbon monoxide dehydrogenase subunit G
MELTNDFRVGVPIDQAWDVLTDVERIAPCLPGAQLQEVEGDVYRGIVKVKVGPIAVQYKGQAHFLERDDDAHKAVLRAEGRETRGQGNANATITASLAPHSDGTAVSIVTDLAITGRVAQFGRGVLADVSTKLLHQFVDCLESTVLAGDTAESTRDRDEATAEAPTPVDAPLVDEAATAPSAVPRRIESPEPQPVDLIDAAGTPVAKRVGPIVAVIALLWLLRRLLRRR